MKLPTKRKLRSLKSLCLPYQVLTTIVGAILILTAGALSITYHASLLRSQYNYNTYDAHAGMAMGVIAIIAGVLLVVDFILSVRKMKITIG